MKKAVFYLFLLAALGLCSCSTSHIGVDRGVKALDVEDIAVIEPYTDIQTYLTTYKEEKVHSDSLTAVAHQTLMEVLADYPNWKECKVIRPENYDSIGEDVFAIIKNDEKPSKVKATTPPASLLNSMEADSLDFAMVILQKGYEPGPNAKINRYQASSGRDNGSFSFFASYLVGRKDSSVIHYDWYGHRGIAIEDGTREGFKPTDSQTISTGLNYVLDKAPLSCMTSAYTDRDKLKSISSGVCGISGIQVPSTGFGGQPIPDMANAGFQVELEYLHSIWKSKLFLGVSAAQSAQAVSANDGGQKLRRERDNIVPKVAYVKPFGKQNTLTVAAGAGYQFERCEDEVGVDAPAFYQHGHRMVEALSITYTFWRSRYLGVSLRANAYSFNNNGSVNYSNSIIDSWNISLGFSSATYKRKR